MRKYTYSLLGVILIAMVIISLYIEQKNKPPKNDPVIVRRVKVAYKKSVPSFPIFVGDEKGYFKQHGIEVEPVVFESTNQIVEAVVRGDVDAAAVGAPEAALAAEAVSPGHFKFYSQVRWTKDNFLDYVLVKKDSLITSIDQLKNKK